MARYRHADLVQFASRLFAAAGMPPERADVVGHYLVEADAMGHDTHGLQLAPRYLEDLGDGRMEKAGAPEVLADRKAAVVWNGRRLSGVWLTVQAIDVASERAREYGTASVAIGESHHIACLAAYLPRATDRGQMLMIASSNPAVATVVPVGGLDAVFTPDPFAFGIPTEGDPILIDMSASITTNGLAQRLSASGGKLPGAWAQDRDGNATADPGVISGGRGGALLPTGGHEYGHKGTNLALMIEALGQGLSGEGRSKPGNGLGASVLIQVWEPDCFAGTNAFRREMSALAAKTKASRPRPGVEAVRLPGERALAKRRHAMSNGVPLYPGIMEALAPVAARFGVAMPAASD